MPTPDVPRLRAAPLPQRRAALVTLGLRPQRGRLRGAGRAAVAAAAGSWSTSTRTAARRTSSSSTPAASSSRPRRTRSTRCSPRRTSRGDGREGRRGRLPGRALRRGAGREPARGGRGARLRRLPRSRRAPRRRARRPRGRPRTCRSTGAPCCRSRPVQRPAAAADVAVPGHAWVPDLSRVRAVATSPYAPLKLASGCDRRCAFCAIPSFRGSFVSRPPHEVLGRGARGWPGRAYARWCWSARTPPPTARTCRAAPAPWTTCCPRWPRSPGLDRVRVSYLQPAEMRPDLLRRRSRRRPGSRPTSTCRSSTPARRAAPDAAVRLDRRSSSTCATGSARSRPRPGIRSNVIVGFPGETEDDVAELERVPHRGAAGRGRRVRLLRRGRHGGRAATTARCRPRRSPRGSRGSPRWSTS